MTIRLNPWLGLLTLLVALQAAAVDTTLPAITLTRADESVPIRVDGNLDEAGARELNAAIESDPEACAVFEEVSQQAFALADSGEASLTASSVVSFPGNRYGLVSVLGLAKQD